MRESLRQGQSEQRVKGEELALSPPSLPAAPPSTEAGIVRPLLEPGATPEVLFERLCELYTGGRDSVEVDALLDQLPEQTQEQLTKGYLLSICGVAAFPDLKTVRELIEQHATTVLQNAVQRSGATLRFSGYDSSSSLGRNIPLPGSDIDHWIVVINGSEEQARQIRDDVRRNVNPLIANLHHSSHAPPLVMTQKDLFSSLPLTGTRDSFYLVRLPLQEWQAARTEWASPAAEQKARPYLHSTPGELKALALQFANDREHVAWLHASCLVETVREGVVLENSFSPEDLQQIRNSHLFRTSNQLQQVRNVQALQSKHRAREALSGFDALTTTEQFLLVRVFLDNHLRHDSEHNHLFELTPENPNLKTVESLIEQGILCYRDPVLDDSVPGNAAKDYHALLPYLTAGRFAEAPFHNHYPFERDLPFDY